MKEKVMSPGVKYMWGIAAGVVVGLMALGLFFVMAVSSYRDGDVLFSYIFPFPVISSHLLMKLNSQFAFFSPGNIRSFVTAIGLVQMPVYGFILAHAWVRQKLGPGLLVVGGAHLLAILIALMLGGYSSAISS
jgi:hypothetical protein